MGKTLLPDDERTIDVHRKVVGADEKAATPTVNKELRPIQLSGGGGNRTLHLTSDKTNISKTQTMQNLEDSQHMNTLREAELLTPLQIPTLLAQPKDKAIHSECAVCVQRYRSTLTADLSEVVDAWDNLPDAVRAGILAMVHATGHK
jgi:hypothetical protein